MQAPTLKTSRLILRAHTRNDFDACAAMWADPAVVRHIGGQPSSRPETWTRLLRYAGHWALLGYGFWVLEDAASGRYAGEAGFFANIHREPKASLGEVPEVGWALSPWAHGRGLATEAVRAIVAWGDGHFGPGRRTVALIAPENTASIRVAEKCGYRLGARETFPDGEPALRFERSS